MLRGMEGVPCRGTSRSSNRPQGRISRPAGRLSAAVAARLGSPRPRAHRYFASRKCLRKSARRSARAPYSECSARSSLSRSALSRRHCSTSACRRSPRHRRADSGLFRNFMTISSLFDGNLGRPRMPKRAIGMQAARCAVWQGRRTRRANGGAAADRPPAWRSQTTSRRRPFRKQYRDACVVVEWTKRRLRHQPAAGTGLAGHHITSDVVLAQPSTRIRPECAR